ncbi:MAG: response regulator, partial [Cyanobacteria bacterium J06642_11]
LVMPIANGYEVCAQIRRISAFKNTPVIIVTANDGLADRVRAKVVGASGFMSKPINEKRVLKVLKKCTQSRKNTRKVMNPPQKLVAAVS